MKKRDAIRRLRGGMERGVKGIYIERVKRLKAAVEAAKNRTEFLNFIEEQYKESRVKLFLFLFSLDARVEYAVPESIHALDPADFLEMLEEKVDFVRLAKAVGYSELELRRSNRKA
jgi:hypothetical protein